MRKNNFCKEKTFFIKVFVKGFFRRNYLIQRNLGIIKEEFLGIENVQITNYYVSSPVIINVNELN